MKKRYLATSFLIHFISLSILFLNGGGSGKGDGNSDTEGKEGQGKYSDGGEFIPKSIEVEVIVQQALKDGDVPVESKKTEGVKDCKGDAWYGGIGIRQDFDGTVQDVARGYPAALAGMRPGDRIVWTSEMDIRGEVGTTVILKVIREGNELTFTLTRDKICYID